MNNIEQAILRTLTWFDVFDYPLKLEEIYYYLIRLPAKSLEDLNITLDRLTQQKLIGEKSGYYFLHHREVNIQTRQQRAAVFERKIKKAKKIARKLRLFPWIKAITVCNTLGYGNAPVGSDIDLFIITNKDRVWVTRFFVLSTLKLLRVRPQLSRFGSVREKRQDKIDANFFLSENSLNIESLAIEEDIYLSFWIIQQIPLLDLGNTYEKFIESNAWIKANLPNHSHKAIDYDHCNHSAWSLGKLIKALTLNIDERFYRWLQLKILPQKLKDMSNKSSGVIINDSTLKFHDQDRRAYFKNLWLEKIQKLKLL